MAPRTTPPTLDPRKKPRQSRSAATVAAVLEAAARILETEGFEAYTTNAVARRAGISIGSLYQYFPSKDAITKALMLRETAQLLEDVAAINVKAGGRAGLQRLIKVAVAYQLQRPALARLLDVEERRLPVGEEVQRIGEQLALTVQRCLDAPDMAGTFRAPFVASDLLAIVKGLVDSAGDRGEHDDVLLAARVSRAVFGYLEHGSTSAKSR
ncbi:TetR/AcrR family transcriptional regulator [Archangium minus]|uniref:TetR/AcrR family transcriptional regulator n=1 Tax=Archangium minus TaxID=83450 RepID=A0ABY9WYE7_9BACT|nr:TetR/AcrR family transcriptional regulator [Archangium minus]